MIDNIERNLVEELPYYLNKQKKIGVQPDIIFFLTMTGVKGFEIPRSSFDQFPGEVHEIDRDVLVLPEIVIKQFDVNSGRLLRPHFDLLWNACGHPHSPNYDEEGNWKLIPKFSH